MYDLLVVTKQKAEVLWYTNTWSQDRNTSDVKNSVIIIKPHYCQQAKKWRAIYLNRSRKQPWNEKAMELKKKNKYHRRFALTVISLSLSSFWKFWNKLHPRKKSKWEKLCSKSTQLSRATIQDMQHSIPLLFSTGRVILHRLDKWKYQEGHWEFNRRNYSRINDNHCDTMNVVPLHKSNVIDKVINRLLARPKAGYC